MAMPTTMPTTAPRMQPPIPAVAIVTPTAAALWTDSRYWLQAEAELAGTPHHRVVGHAIAAEYRDDGLYMSFRVAATEDGDRAMLDVTEERDLTELKRKSAESRERFLMSVRI